MKLGLSQVEAIEEDLAELTMSNILGTLCNFIPGTSRILELSEGSATRNLKH